MKTIDLIRLEGVNETRGVIRVDKQLVCWSLEPPWRMNQRDISCIPPGQYRCIRHNSFKFGETFRLVDVPNRQSIIFHWGNQVRDTAGCILTGKSLGLFDGRDAVLDSMGAFHDFMRVMGKTEEAVLTVQEVY